MSSAGRSFELSTSPGDHDRVARIEPLAVGWAAVVPSRCHKRGERGRHNPRATVDDPVIGAPVVVRELWTTPALVGFAVFGGGCRAAEPAGPDPPVEQARAEGGRTSDAAVLAAGAGATSGRSHARPSLPVTLPPLPLRARAQARSDRRFARYPYRECVGSAHFIFGISHSPRGYLIGNEGEPGPSNHHVNADRLERRAVFASRISDHTIGRQ